MEYTLLLLMAVILAMGFLTTFQSIISKGIFKFNAVLESELRTGEHQNPTPVQIWEN